MHNLKGEPDQRVITDPARINRFKPSTPVPAPPANLPIWHYWNIFFTEKFRDDPGLNAIRYYDPGELAGDLIARFGGKFDIDEIRKYLEFDYKIAHTRYKYEIRREDFIKPITE